MPKRAFQDPAKYAFLQQLEAMFEPQPKKPSFDADAPSTSKRHYRDDDDYADALAVPRKRLEYEDDDDIQQTITRKCKKKLRKSKKIRK